MIAGPQDPFDRLKYRTGGGLFVAKSESNERHFSVSIFRYAGFGIK